MARKKKDPNLIAEKPKRKGSENLIPLNKRSKEEQRRIASLGGKTAVANQKARRTLREELLALLSEGDIQKRMSLAIINEAINGNNKGSVTKAYEVIRDTVGEKPVDKVMIAEVDQNVIDEVEKMMEDDDEETGC